MTDAGGLADGLDGTTTDSRRLGRGRDVQKFERTLRERLAEGAVPYPVMQEISKDVDRYVMAVLQHAGVDAGRQLDRLGALDPRPPAYLEPLGEVLERLALSPRATSQLARVLDERIAERRGSPVPKKALAIPEADRAVALLETVAAFLRGQIKVTEDLLSPLIAQRDQRPAGGPAPTRVGSDGNGNGHGDESPAGDAAAAAIAPPTASGQIVEAAATTLAEVRGDHGDGSPRRTLRVGLRNAAERELAVVAAAGRSDQLGALVAETGLSLAPGSTGHVTLPVAQDVEGEALDTEVTLELAVRFHDVETDGDGEVRVRMRGALTADRWTLEDGDGW